jgi:uncharacterized protein YciI
MKKFLLFLASVFLISTGYSQSENSSIYDSVYAQKLGADDYGMKQYVMAFLKRGPNRDIDSVEAVKLQRAHLDNITKMAEERVLIVAGPFLDNGEIRGIYIFNVTSVEEAEKLTNTDPAIKAGSLVMELHPWYGSAALMEINSIHNKIAKTGI